MPSSNTGQEPSRVLVVEPHPTLRTVLVQRLRQDGHLTAAVANAAEALEVCQEQSPDLPGECRIAGAQLRAAAWPSSCVVR
jgi:CheY-like chemotaxis protein